MMADDSTYVVQAERVTTSDTVFYQIDKKDLKALYEEAFGNMIDENVAREHLTLTLTYIPLVLVFTLLIALVNKRWNKAYERLKSKESEVELSEQDKENIKKLDLQSYRIPDRIFFYTVVWILAAIFDTLMLLNGVLDVPWAAIAAAVFMITRVITRLIEGSTLMGLNDSDVVKNYGEYIKNMLKDRITEKLKTITKLK